MSTESNDNPTDLKQQFDAGEVVFTTEKAKFEILLKRRNFT